MAENGEGAAARPRARRRSGVTAAAERRTRAKNREGVEGVEGISTSFEWKTRDTKEQVEMRAIHDVLAQHPGRDAAVKRFRTEQGASEFADALREAHPDLDVEARGVAVFAMKTPEVVRTPQETAAPGSEAS